MLRAKPGKPSRHDEDLADALQAAILGSMVPTVSSALDARHARGRSRSGRGAGLGLPLIVGVAVGVGVAAWARRDPGPSPLGEDDEWELAGGGPLQGTKDAINETLDRADAAIRKAVGATAASMGIAVDAVAEAAAPAAERMSGQLRVARGKATSEVIRALDDVEDVWGDEGDDATATRPTPKVPKRPAPRKPVVGTPPKPSTRVASAPASSQRDTGGETGRRKPPAAQGGA
jgi:hypothetical protein